MLIKYIWISYREKGDFGIRKPIDTVGTWAFMFERWGTKKSIR